MKRMIVVLVLSLLTSSLYACQCPAWSTESWFENSDFVVIAKGSGKTVKRDRESYSLVREDGEKEIYEKSYREALFSRMVVIDSYKGSLKVGESFELDTGNGLSCEGPTGVEAEFLIMGYIPPNNEYTVSVCSMTLTRPVNIAGIQVEPSIEMEEILMELEELSQAELKDGKH